MWSKEDIYFKAISKIYHNTNFTNIKENMNNLPKANYAHPRSPDAPEYRRGRRQMQVGRCT